MIDDNRDDLLAKISEHLSENITKTIFYSAIGDNNPKYGEIVLAYHFAGKRYSFNNQLGRVVQIRTKCGQFGSDMYFLRMPDGSLITAENQSYRKIPEQFIDEVESYFETNLDDEKEGVEKGYSIGGKQEEVGYIISGENTSGSPDTHFSITTIL